MKRLFNQTIGTSEPVWTIDGLTYSEVCSQEYSGARVSAGLVEGDPVETHYFRLERRDDPSKEIFVLMRADEIAILAWCINGALFSTFYQKVFPNLSLDPTPEVEQEEKG